MKDPKTYDSSEASYSVIPRAQLDSMAQSTPATTHDEAVVEADVELEQEEHEPPGLIDAAKALLLWRESSEERVDHQDLNPPETK